jgi:hypothetical protein
MSFHLRNIDLLVILVYGFAFLVLAIDNTFGVGYIVFLIMSSLALGLINHNEDKKNKNE